MVNSTKIKTIILKCFDIKINFRFRIPPQRKHCTNQNSNRNPTTLTPTLTFQSRTLTATRTGFFFGFGKTGPFCLMHFWKWKTKSFCFFFLLLIQTNSQKHSFFRFWTKNRIKYTILPAQLQNDFAEKWFCYSKWKRKSQLTRSSPQLQPCKNENWNCNLNKLFESLATFLFFR